MKKLLVVLSALLSPLLAAAPAGAAPLNDAVLHASVSRAFHPLLMQLTGAYAEDTAHVSGHFGTMILGVRRDTPTSLAGADNDYMPFTMNSSGAVWVAGNGTFTVSDGSGALNVIVDSSALPTGAATSANQTTVIGHLDGVEGLLTTIDADTSTLAGTVAGAEVQVDVLTSALPSGASTAANQATEITALQIIDNLPLAQGSTTAGQTGPLVQGAVTTAAPTYTTGQTNPLSLTTAGELRVAGSFSGGGDGAIQDGVSAAIEATVFDLTNSNPLSTQIVDANGDAITSFGGGTQYTEDAAAAANPVGTALNLVREDARAGSLTTTDGDNVAARGTNAGELYVKHVDSIPATQSGTWDEVGINDSGNSITVDSPVLSVVGGGTEATAQRVTIASDSTGVLTVDGSVTANAGTNLNTSALLTTAAHDAALGTAGTADAQVRTVQGIAAMTPLLVDGSGATQPVSGTVTVTDGVGALNVIVDSSALPSGASTLAEQQTQTTSLSVLDDWDNAASDGASISGDVAHDAADAGEPAKVGGKAFSVGTGQTAVAANDRVNAAFSREGVQWVLPYNPNTTTVEYLWTTAQTDDALVTVAAGTRIAVVGYELRLDEAGTTGVAVRCGFAAATLPTIPTDGNTASGVFLNVRGVIPGGGANSAPGLFVAGADGEDLRCTTEATTGGTGTLIVSHFTFAN